MTTFQLPADQRDFSNWLAYHNHTHPEAPLDSSVAWRIYNDYYPCNCEGCAQRKRLGVIPMHIGPGCSLPAGRTAISEAYVTSWLEHVG